MIPEHILSAIHKENLGRPARAYVAGSVEPGDIRRISSGQLDRLVLVLQVNSESNLVIFTLVHSSCEFATEHDLILGQEDTGLPYAIVIQTDLRAPVSTAELGKLIARVPLRVVRACLDGLGHNTDSSDYLTGTPLLGPLDARWDFKIEEGEAIRELSSNAIESFKTPENQWTFDFDPIFAALLLPVDDASAMAEAMYEQWLLGGDHLVVTPDHLVLFDDRGLLSVDVWSNALGEVGVHFYNSVLMYIIEQARSAMGTHHQEPTFLVGVEELRELQNV